MFTNSVLILGAIINLAGTASYVRDTLKGKTKPNRITWSLWSVAPFIAFAAQVQEGVGLYALLTFMSGFCPLLILVASFIGKHAKWRLSGFDIACGVFAVLGIVLWQVMDNAVYGLIFAILADFAAGLPTIYKCLRFPETENYHAFLAPAIAAALTLAVTTEWSFIASGFAVYLLCVTTLMASLVRFRPGRLFYAAEVQ